MNDVDAKQCQLKSVLEKMQVYDMPHSLQQQLNELQCEFEHLKSLGETTTQQLTLSFADSQALHNSLHTAMLWIDGKELELRAGNTLPLTSVDAKKKLEDSKVALRIIHCLQELFYQLFAPYGLRGSNVP